MLQNFQFWDVQKYIAMSLLLYLEIYQFFNFFIVVLYPLTNSSSFTEIKWLQSNQFSNGLLNKFCSIDWKRNEHLGHYNNIELSYVYPMPHNSSRLRLKKKQYLCMHNTIPYANVTCNVIIEISYTQTHQLCTSNFTLEKPHF